MTRLVTLADGERPQPAAAVAGAAKSSQPVRPDSAGTVEFADVILGLVRFVVLKKSKFGAERRRTIVVNSTTGNLVVFGSDDKPKKR